MHSRSKKMFSRVLVLAAMAVVGGACESDSPPSRTYFDRNIQPILSGSCSGNTAGCHSTNAGDPFQVAAGNLDLTSFDGIQKRRDVLKTFGPYPVPLLLVKGVGPTDELVFNYNGEAIPLEVQHAGGSVLTVGSDAYLELLTWLENGATANGRPPAAPPQQGSLPCSNMVPAQFDPSTITSNPFFGDFKKNVQPVLKSCAGGECHGAPPADFSITCGDTEAELAYNFFQAQAFVDEPVDNSEILNVPLAISQGGLFHTGGEHFDTRSGGDYKAVRDWAESVGKLEFGVGDPGRTFFAQNVQPILIKRGCMFEACHSSAATNDMKLRSGSQGSFSVVALEKNYNILRNEFMAMEVPDARRSRTVMKTILRSLGGGAHRGGPVLETVGAGGSDPARCDAVYDSATATAFCTLQEWVNVVRVELVSAGEISSLAEGTTVPIVYIERSASHLAGPLEFDTFQGGSDLRVVDADIGAVSSLSVTAAPVSLLGGCGIDTGTVDVSAPDVDHTGRRVVFSARISAGEGRQIWTVDIDGQNCTQLTQPESGNNMSVHNFDPAWSPDGQWIVFASTRGTVSGSPTPSVSRAKFLPQSDIFRIPAAGGTLEKMTFLTNSEISPQFMREGRVIMTTEKVAQDFYQLSGRRLNWDITDYHPLLGQRSESLYANLDDLSEVRPSVGYQRATEIREGFDGNFLAVFSDDGVRGGAGTIGVFNRSVGPFEAGRDDPGYLRSVEFLDPAATGRAGATSGAYRSPFPLLDGRVMASYAGASNLAAPGQLDWDIVALGRNGSREVILGGPGAQVEAVLAVPYPERELYYNFRQLVFGGGIDTDITGGPEWAVIHMPDAPLIFTVLTANLRRGRPVDAFRSAKRIAFYQENSPPAGTTSGNVGAIYENRTLVGTVPLRDDGSTKVRVPAGVGVIMELQDGDGNTIVTMEEEHQLGPGETISLGIPEALFDPICGGCHGSVSGLETDVFVTPDALTGASGSLSANADPYDI